MPWTRVLMASALYGLTVGAIYKLSVYKGGAIQEATVGAKKDK